MPICLSKALQQADRLASPGWLHSASGSKKQLNPVAAVLQREERIAGVCRLPFTALSSCGFVVTNRNVYFCGPSGLGHDRWANLLEQLPAVFHVNPELVTIPWTRIDEISTDKRGFSLKIINGPEIQFSVISWKSSFIGHIHTRSRYVTSETHRHGSGLCEGESRRKMVSPSWLGGLGTADGDRITTPPVLCS